jgi:prophage regulatory protein
MIFDRFLRVGEVCHLTGFSRSTLYRMISDGTFPAPKKIGSRAVAWLESSVARWIQEKAA